MQIYFHSCLWSYLPRVPILVEDTVYIKNMKNILKVYFNHLVPPYWLVPQGTRPIPSMDNPALSAMDDGKCSPVWRVVWKSIWWRDDLLWQSDKRPRTGFMTISRDRTNSRIVTASHNTVVEWDIIYSSLSHFCGASHYRPYEETTPGSKHCGIQNYYFHVVFFG